ncbi:MAG: hypothetical protein HY301_06660 [Verrucomicrobia bacterium]|nr:hypothetical protein [Verrucomicrobiota bacterium]
MQRNITELPRLKQFRAFCLVSAGSAFGVLLLLSVITFVPSSVWVAARAMLLATIVALYFVIIAGRTQVVIYQLSRSLPQSIDRPAPEWITVPFFLAAIAVVFWPHVR